MMAQKSSIYRPCKLNICNLSGAVSYPVYRIYKTVDWEPTDEIIYSDRLYQWYPDKYDECKEKFLGVSDYLTSYTPDQIEQFLSALMKYSIHITRIDEEYNMHNGYPYWKIYFTR